MPYLDYKGSYNDLFLTNYMVTYKTGNFIADEVATVVKVEKPTGKFYKRNRQAARTTLDNREAGTAAKEISGSFTSDTYSCKQHRHIAALPTELIRHADSILSPRMAAAEMIKEQILHNREVRVATLFRSTGGFTGANPLVKWDAYDNTASVPLQNIVDNLIAVHSALGEAPNVIIIPFDVQQKLSNHPTFMEHFMNFDPRFLTTAGIPNIIKGLRVITPTRVNDPSNEGQTGTLSYVWGEDVVIARVNPNPGMDGLNAITTFAEYTDQVRRWIDEPKESEIIEYGNSLDEKVIDTNAARIITNVLS